MLSFLYIVGYFTFICFFFLAKLLTLGTLNLDVFMVFLAVYALDGDCLFDVMFLMILRVLLVSFGKISLPIDNLLPFIFFWTYG